MLVMVPVVFLLNGFVKGDLKEALNSYYQTGLKNLLGRCSSTSS